MKKILLSALTVLMLNANTTASVKNDLPRTVDTASQQKADAQLKLQNKEIIKMVVEEIGKTLPQTIDKYTKFVSIEDNNLTLLYTYEILTGSKSDDAVRSEDKPRMEEFVIEGICQSSKRFLQADIDITYVYKNTVSKAELFRFEIKAKDCKRFWEE